MTTVTAKSTAPNNIVRDIHGETAAVASEKQQRHLKRRSGTAREHSPSYLLCSPPVFGGSTRSILPIDRPTTTNPSRRRALGKTTPTTKGGGSSYWWCALQRALQSIVNRNAIECFSAWRCFNPERPTDTIHMGILFLHPGDIMSTEHTLSTVTAKNIKNTTTKQIPIN